MSVLVLGLALVAQSEGTPDAAAQEAKESEPTSLVALDGQQASVDTGVSPARLSFGVRATSRLPVPVSEVHLGIMYGEVSESLREVDAGALYKKGAGTSQVGLLDERAAVVLPPGGQAFIRFDRKLPDKPNARIFVTHVLGYDVTAASGKLLLEMLATSAAADEVAAVRAMALDGGPEDKRAVRAKWGGRQDLVDTLLDAARAPVPEQLTDAELIRRVYAVRALGILGGEPVAAALRDLRGQEGLARLDEPLQVLRLAQLHGSKLETPVAFSVPPKAETFVDVIDTALTEVAGWPEAVAPSAEVLDEPSQPAAEGGVPIWVAVVALVAGLGAGVLLARRKR